MTLYVDSPYGGSSSLPIDDGNYDYTYTRGLDLNPRGEQHGKLLTKLNRLVERSNTFIKRRLPDWIRMDDMCRTYIPQEEVDELDRREDSDPTKPIRIVYPYSLAILESGVSATNSIFLNSDPIFRYMPMAPEDIIKAKMLEAVINQHTKRFKVPLALSTMYRDGFKYGLGVGFPQWRREGQIAGFTSPGSGTGRAGVYEGNALQAVDPFDYLPDPSVDCQSIQQGQYVGIMNRLSRLTLLQLEEAAGYFNVRYLPKRGNVLSQYKIDRNVAKGKNPNKEDDIPDANLVDVAYLYVTLIPEEWGLGNGDYPEKWFFAVAGDRLILAAWPVEFNHNMYPVAVCAPTFDGHSALPISKLEYVEGIQDTINWLLNAHIANLRKAIHSVVVYDPSVISTKDLLNPDPAKYVRVRKYAFGRGAIEQSIKQLTIQDVTARNISDAGALISMMHNITGMDDSSMGVLRQGGPERLSASEYQGTQAAFLGRLENMVMNISYMGHRDIGYLFAKHTQEFMTDSTYTRILGEIPENLQEEYNRYVQVSPSDLNIDFDLIIEDARTNSGQDVNLWFNLWQAVASNEQLMQRYDDVRIFQHLAKVGGAKDFSEFIRRPPRGDQPQQAIQPLAMNDEEVARNAMAGNLVPTEDYASQLGI